MEYKKEYPQGIYWHKRYEKSPDFILGRIDIDREKAIKWLQEKEGQYVRLQLLKPYVSKDAPQGTIVGEPYLSVDNYKKQEDFDTSKGSELPLNIQEETIPF